MIEQREDPPSCFGKAWDESEAACAGGRDPTYTDSDTGAHIRERCLFFTACGARLQATKMQKLLPVSSLVRPPQQTAPVQQPMQSTSFSAPHASVPQALQLQQLMEQVNQMQRVIHQQNAQLQSRSVGMGYPMQLTPQMQTMAVDYSMPKYLTVPEPRGDNSVWSLLGREVVRSMMKSAGHTLANFWDTTPIGK